MMPSIFLLNFVPLWQHREKIRAAVRIILYYFQKNIFLFWYFDCTEAYEYAYCSWFFFLYEITDHKAAAGEKHNSCCIEKNGRSEHTHFFVHVSCMNLYRNTAYKRCLSGKGNYFTLEDTGNVSDVIDIKICIS
jgi:hypothetical protein